MASSPKPLGPPFPNVDIGWQLEVGTTVTFLCACIAVGFRTLARAKYARVGWDDGMMLFALAQALIATVFDFLAVNYGLGRHLMYLSPQQAVSMQYWQLLSQVFCINALTFAKISICMSYLRVIRGSQNKAMKWSLYACAASVFIINTIIIISFYAACNPPAKAYNVFLPGVCWPLKTQISLVLLQGSWSAVTDFFLALFPFLLFRDLHVGRRSKAILLGLMSLGVVTCAFAIVRTVEGSAALHAPPNATPDLSYSSVSGLMWAGMERNIAIMIGSIPAIRPLAAPFTKLVSGTFGSRSKTSQGTYEMGNSKGYSKGSSKNSSRNPFKKGSEQSSAAQSGGFASKQDTEASAPDVLATNYSMADQDFGATLNRPFNPHHKGYAPSGSQPSASVSQERIDPHYQPTEQV